MEERALGLRSPVDIVGNFDGSHAIRFSTHSFVAFLGGKTRIPLPTISKASFGASKNRLAAHATLLSSVWSYAAKSVLSARPRTHRNDATAQCRIGCPA